MPIVLSLGGILANAQASGGSPAVTLYTFTGGSDGGSPNGGLTWDAQQAAIYGVTFSGGAKNLGTIFKLDNAGNETVVYSFKGKPDGEHPSRTVLLDAQGNFYGTNYEGGANSYGGVYELDASGTESVLYSFGPGTDGEYPGSGVIADQAGDLLGTTGYGGTAGDGTIFQVTLSGQERILHNFTGADGQYPFGDLLRDASGNLYGTTSMGGAHGYGTVWELTAQGQLLVLHNFANGSDGANPYAGLIKDVDGNLYGTTYNGGQGCRGFGCGTIYRLDAQGNYTVFHVFGSKEEPSDGHYPDFGTLVVDSSGNLYGTTYAGGVNDKGTVFEITTAGAETVLYNFTNGPDEEYPISGLILDKSGDLYGTTSGNPSTTYGTVFKINH